jgi:RNA polymerase sigma factor for flagellar operon FliA
METGVKEVELRDLWRRYKDDGDRTARERLVVAYSPLVKFVAGRLGAGLPSHVDDADLISYGLMGLIGAIERFEPERGIKFETFAMTRIRGAIIDELRSLDWVPRSVRSRAREIEAAQTKLEHELQRAPTEAELAAKVGLSEEELQTSLLEIANSSVYALDDLRLLRRLRLAARHDLRSARRGSAGVARRQRDQGPADRVDRGPAGARAAGRRALLLREPHPA